MTALLKAIEAMIIRLYTGEGPWLILIGLSLAAFTALGIHKGWWSDPEYELSKRLERSYRERKH